MDTEKLIEAISDWPVILQGVVGSAIFYLITFDHVFRYLITGLLFACIAILVAGTGKLVFSIILAATIYYLLRALAWLTPKKEWMGDNLSNHWKRVATLEKMFFGKVDEDTQSFLDKYVD